MKNIKGSLKTNRFNCAIVIGKKKHSFLSVRFYGAKKFGVRQSMILMFQMVSKIKLYPQVLISFFLCDFGIFT